jgi:hypothetical protein
MSPFGLSPYPRGPRSSPGYAVPIHQHLIDHPSHWQARFDFPSCGYTKRLSCAGEPRPPASGSVLSLQMLIDMSPSLTPEKSVAALIQFLRHRHGLRQVPNGSAFSSIPQIRFAWGGDFGALQRFTCATTCRLVCLPDGSDSAFALSARTFTFRLPTEQSPTSDAGYCYRGNWIISTGRTLDRLDLQLASLHEDFHLQAVEHARAHQKNPASRGRVISGNATRCFLFGFDVTSQGASSLINLDHTHELLRRTVFEILPEPRNRGLQ